MKKTIFYIVVFFLVSAVIISCEKENDSDDSRYRIIKIADNNAMENPWYTFEYDSEGRLIRESESDDPIIYDSQNRPIKIDPYTLTWDNTGFTQTHQDWADRKEICILNSNHLIDREIELWYNSITEKFDTVKVIKYDWTGNTNLKKVCTYYGALDENDGWEETYSFGVGNNPLKGFDVSIVLNSIGEWAEWTDPQNVFLTTAYSEESFQATIVYDFNEQNYPVRADITYTSSEGTFHDYVYFEYESY